MNDHHGPGRPPVNPATRRLTPPFRISPDALSAATVAALRAGIPTGRWVESAILQTASADAGAAVPTPSPRVSRARATVPRETKSTKLHKNKEEKP